MLRNGVVGGCVYMVDATPCLGRVWDDITCFACGHMVDATQL